MKKVLLATTVLALSAGVASAEITLSGSARMGVVHTGAVASKPATYNAALSNGALSALNARATATLTSPAALSGATAADQRTSIATRRGLLVTARGSATTAADIAAIDAAILELDTNSAALLNTAAVDAVAAKTALDSRFTVNVNASTETSSGLTFGASMRLRSSKAAAAGTNGARVYMKSGAVEVAVGNIYGAIDSMPGLYQSEAGLTGNGAGDVGSIAAYDGYVTNGAGVNGAEVIYSAGAFTGHLSVTDSAMGSSANRTAAHVAYTSGDWTVALGTQNSDVAAEDLTAFTVSGKVGDYGVGLSGMRANGESKVTLNGSATFGATTVSAFVSDETTAGAENAYGVGVAYDLGGASLVGAVERNSNGTNYADLGVSFSF